MSRRKNQRSYGNYVLLTLLVGLICYLFPSLVRLIGRSDPQSIVEDSVLKARNFETEVVEVVSPKYKIKAYLFEDKTNPIVSLSLLFKNAGWAADDADNAGISNLAVALLDSGAGDLKAEYFQEELENKAIGLSFAAGMDDISGSLLTTKKHSARAYELLKMALLEPRFDDLDLQRQKAQAITALRLQQERPNSLLQLAFQKEIYGAHPYGRNPLGDKTAISRADSEMLKKIIKQRLSRNNLIVGAAGDISAEELGEVLDQVFGRLPESTQLNFVRDAEPEFDGRIQNLERPAAQDISTFAVSGVKRKDPDFYPLYVANYIFGGSGLTSRLNVAVREKEGLTYGAYTYLSLPEKSALLVGGFSATPENFSQVTQILKQEWSRFANKGASEQEVNEAKDAMIASYNLRFAAIGDIAEMLAMMQREDLGLDFLQKRNDYVRAITKEEVNQVADKYFEADKMVFVNIGNFEHK